MAATKACANGDDETDTRTDQRIINYFTKRYNKDKKYVNSDFQARLLNQIWSLEKGLGVFALHKYFEAHDLILIGQC